MDNPAYASLAKLRDPFPANQISKLPKESRAQIDERKQNKGAAISCTICGGWHHKNAVHLDYVGHAALTDRLLDTDIQWSWEPLSFGDDGLPAFDRNNGLWIKLTVQGVTRLGYGAADGKSGGDAIKEIIGDALRNAAMRFGAALDLWHKGDLHAEDEPARQASILDAPTKAPPPKPREKLTGPHMTVAALKDACAEIKAEVEAANDRDTLDTYLILVRETLDQVKRDKETWWSNPDYGLDGIIAEAYRRVEMAEANEPDWRANPILAG